MFLGHFAVALAAKRVAPRVSLGTLMFAAQWVDLLWPALLLLGWERVRIDPSQSGFNPLVFAHYPISHSLISVIGWGALLGGAYFLLMREVRAALLVGGLVISHWLLDLVVHRPDLPLLPDGQLKVGFGLWASTPATLVVELGLFALGALLFVGATPGARRWPLWLLLSFLLVVYLAGAFGPPPPSADAIAWVGLSQWLIVLAAYAMDRPARPTVRIAAA
jgi:hypothetical protein